MRHATSEGPMASKKRDSCVVELTNLATYHRKVRSSAAASQVICRERLRGCTRTRRTDDNAPDYDGS